MTVSFQLPKPEIAPQPLPSWEDVKAGGTIDSTSTAEEVAATKQEMTPGQYSKLLSGMNSASPLGLADLHLDGILAQSGLTSRSASQPLSAGTRINRALQTFGQGQISSCFYDVMSGHGSYTELFEAEGIGLALLGATVLGVGGAAGMVGMEIPALVGELGLDAVEFGGGAAALGFAGNIFEHLLAGNKTDSAK